MSSRTTPPARFAGSRLTDGASRLATFSLLAVTLLVLAVDYGHALPYTPPGDTLTVIMRPILNVPAIVVRGDTFDIDCAAPPSTTSWAASLFYRSVSFPLTVTSAQYETSLSRWKLKALVPASTPFELYDLIVAGSGGVADTTLNAVQVITGFDSNFYFVHVTDTHLPTHLYWEDAGSDTDSSELVDLREVIKDINVINPAFLLLTGDLINEGELEDFEYRRYFTRSQRLLTELEIPVFLTSGNHDIGGWASTPPPAGEARRNWWKFFGWPYLNSPPPGDPACTQDYSFDYGSCHFIGMEAYLNYDMWRSDIYGSQSFTSSQLSWLNSDLTAASGSALQVMFYHDDFSDQLNLASLGVDLALWGHIHRDQGALVGWPLDLATNACCDGKRAYRMVRINGTTITPSASIAAGPTGTKLTTSFSPANDGRATNMSATITNQHTQAFERGMIRFYMRSGYSYSVTNGNLLQTMHADSVTICYVGVNVPSASSITVYVDGVVGVEEVPPTVVAASCYPNPFESATNIRFSLSQPAPVEVSVFGIDGRLVRLLERADLQAGSHVYEWNGLDGEGNPVSPGVYLCRVDAPGTRYSAKLLVLR
ncbi:MAG: metallophosphoesterase [Candidatus Eisenbacteria bacterium]